MALVVPETVSLVVTCQGPILSSLPQILVWYTKGPQATWPPTYPSAARGLGPPVEAPRHGAGRCSRGDVPGSCGQSWFCGPATSQSGCGAPTGKGAGRAGHGATGSPGQPHSPSEMTGFSGQCKHLIISLVAFLRRAVSCAVDKSSFVFLECSL